MVYYQPMSPGVHTYTAPHVRKAGRGDRTGGMRGLVDGIGA